ncbi:MAG: hypothetical protein COW00_10465 [Bdellovibrio sp. CG12_big_fil_rev_8_21_14_0_65_39_13]|nr:MAG: hypothetical protein COW78_00850 [Bdellovibrio sp. CG22_combo_CG10-13_8_21_14_all_39_27]PIQ59533.1 MAG: hypothetical protein COW00_10465 [Bdellovibrio sp. CG12_big_fil_rev_8_21_14_0_65_39_13]PIR33462.1 MAG: hypothetical protein COV37_16020 [Bdellovibrio sp. CG11_big_fil_rev_8_21_14_0_20_39_38]
MKKLIATLLILSSCSTHKMKDSGKIKLFHYNIKELDSQKLRDSNHPQVQAVSEVLSHYSYDLLSVNEMQYDYPNVPNNLFQSTGDNLRQLLHRLGQDSKQFTMSFYPANTGFKASKKSNGQYAANFEDKESYKLADQESFGLFPAQYSTALASRFPVVRTIQNNSIKWREFNPKSNPSQYTGGDKALNRNMPLFDKNFTDTVINVEGTEVHIITCHTVPAFHFGNKKSPNYVRNGDQLRFLEWYLTGSTDIKVKLKGIAPLRASDKFIAVGDFNTDFQNKENPGSEVIRRMQAKLKSAFPSRTYSYESDGFAPNPFKLRLDYVFYSGLKVVDSEMITPSDERLFLGCDPTIPVQLAGKLPKEREIVSYFDKKKNLTCFDSVSTWYATLKRASDHFPLWVGFDFE